MMPFPSTCATRRPTIEHIRNATISLTRKESAIMLSVLLHFHFVYAVTRIIQASASLKVVCAFFLKKYR